MYISSDTAGAEMAQNQLSTKKSTHVTSKTQLYSEDETLRNETQIEALRNQQGVKHKWHYLFKFRATLTNRGNNSEKKQNIILELGRQ